METAQLFSPLIVFQLICSMLQMACAIFLAVLVRIVGLKENTS